MAKILVADDNSNIQKMVGLALKDQGIDVVAVGNGEAAVRKISDIRPDLVLADVFMPVRNGYEVCRYVKEDLTLKHIPVILLVGAFDPLDEQEAQRVGADGVLKKPFVPPDPLISMVKSALTRAGISIGPPPPVEKTPEPPRRGPTEWLKPTAATKLAALKAVKTPEPEEETSDVPEEFPTQPQQLKIAAGQGPVAFGSLMSTPEVEEEVPAQTTAHSPLADDRKWGAHGEEEEEEHEDGDNSLHARWRPDGLDEALQKTAVPSNDVADWRDEAFHGSSPAKDIPAPPWQTSSAKSPAAASVEAVAVSTLEAKPADSPVPFSGDAWAAAIAADVQEKLARAAETLEKEPEARPKPEAVTETHKEAPPANSWFSSSSTPWETEARKASQLAATWDAPAAETPVAEVAASHQEPLPEAAPPVPEAEPEPVVELPNVAPAEEIHTLEAAPAAVEPQAAPVMHLASPDETQEVPVYKAAESSWNASAPVVEAPVAELPVAEAPTPVAAPVAEPEAKQPDMDALVARVLEKLSPDVLQKVTREFLKPVVEALVKEELNSHKS
ncbi:MAG TPA: response regulator [Candidatus Acidoferrum sp.]|nr:response regulator [Candidatus Acidoferrum sp.]